MPDRNAALVDLFGQVRANDRASPPSPRALPHGRTVKVASVAAVLALLVGILIGVGRYSGSPELTPHGLPEPSTQPRAVRWPAPETPSASVPVAAATAASRDTTQGPLTRVAPAPHARLRTLPEPAPPTSPARETPARRDRPAVDTSTVPIEPYRNGAVAKHLTGEALRRALIEDSRITRELNEATLQNASGGDD